MTNAIPILSIASRFALAAAIVYFAFQLARIVDSLPEIDQSLARVTQQVPPLLETIDQAQVEVAEIRALVPQILDETAAVRGQIPLILEESAQLRASLPLVLNEVAETRRQLPSLLERVDRSVAVVDKTQRQIPRILDSADRATTAIDETRAQIEVLTPQVLSEIRLSREKIDPTLERVDGLINEVYIKAKATVDTAQGAGQEASEGAVKGIVTGILKLPFRLIGTLAAPLINGIKSDVAAQLTQKDIQLMGDAGKSASDSGVFDQPHYWQNPDSGNAGSITLIRRFQLQASQCVEARITIEISGKSAVDELESFCRNADGKWTAATVTKTAD